jgi:hypothetical protein
VRAREEKAAGRIRKGRKGLTLMVIYRSSYARAWVLIELTHAVPNAVQRNPHFCDCNPGQKSAALPISFDVAGPLPSLPY